MYEKCLFWWTEINLYALDMRAQYPNIEFFFLRYEDLFGEDVEATRLLAEFMRLSYKPAMQTRKSEKVDLYQFKTDSTDWSLIFSCPRTVMLAKRFGYNLDKIPLPQISKRYFA